jgi:DNA-binding Xre family transcriptional regulator
VQSKTQLRNASIIFGEKARAMYQKQSKQSNRSAIKMNVTLDKNHIEARIKELSLNQRSASARIGLGYFHFNRLLNGAPFSSTTLGKICDTLELNPEDCVTHAE